MTANEAIAMAIPQQPDILPRALFHYPNREFVPMTRYILYPGYVAGRNGGDHQYIGGSRLARLYGLSPNSPNVIVSSGHRPFYCLPDDVHLFPRQDGNYQLPNLDAVKTTPLP